METKFTKGEWKVRGNKIFIGDTNVSVAAVHVVKNYKNVTFEPIEDIEANANALLISKAPELFEIAVALQKRIQDIINTTPLGSSRAEITETNERILKIINSCI